MSSILFINTQKTLFHFLGIYSYGPQAHLLRGVVEQNVIFHVMDYALCLSESKKEICRAEGLLPKQGSNNANYKTLSYALLVLSVLLSALLV